MSARPTAEQVREAARSRIPVVAAEGLDAAAMTAQELALYVVAHNATCTHIGVSAELQVDRIAGLVLASEPVSDVHFQRIRTFVVDHLQRLRTRQARRREREARDLLDRGKGAP